MSELKVLYSKAFEETKTRVFDDIKHYLEDKDVMPSYEQYVRERSPYVTQIWLNAWLNISTSHATKSEKLAYLEEIGYDVMDVSRKQLNQIFKYEMRSYPPFDVLKWLDEVFVDQEEKWERNYLEARNHYVKMMEEKQEQDRRNRLKRKVSNSIKKILKSHYVELYLRVRYFIAVELLHDIEKNGYIQESPYTTVLTCLNELTDSTYNQHQRFRKYEEYEEYDEKYEALLVGHILDFGPGWLINMIPRGLQQDVENLFNQSLDEAAIKECSVEHLYRIGIDMLENIHEEYVTELIELAKTPFDLEEHQEIFERDLVFREQKQAEILAEIEQRKEKEARMLEDIFGQEYRPKIGRNIHYVLHVGETNTGKTYQALQRMKEADSGLYLAPLRLLALEVFDKLNADGVRCSLKTGEEEKLTEGARHISSTVEMFHEKEFYDVVVIDEAQMIADKDRGFSWYKAITNANAKEVHIVGSFNMKSMVLQLLGNSKVIIHEYTREIPLEVESNEFRLKHTTKGDALVCFSRKRVLETASMLKQSRHRVSMIYGSMPPETRKKQMQMFIDGETNVIVATDAIGMGLNLPIRRIVFLENEKFDGTRRRRLTSQEVKQIAGRAGRKGIYNVGKVAFFHGCKNMSRLLNEMDESLEVFAIAPTNSVLERFQKYSRSLGDFFALWDKFESPSGTKKATLVEERELFELIRDTEIEMKLSVMDLYGFLHLPFSSKEPALAKQWRENMFAIIEGRELPEPIIKNSGLEELELSYKAVGLHLLFLYRLDQRTETLYWERVREEISDDIHETLKSNVTVIKRTCRKCGKSLSTHFKFQICDACHESNYKNDKKRYRRR
ncbi:DEAD/DEAH box helicase [Bacillus salitolerans]|uniref:DEAD/DEAH box helicase n=1 Tax=Bacillus salitolerans TaxID=1437434 RepID=A0ABW4LQX0_9BACI